MNPPSSVLPMNDETMTSGFRNAMDATDELELLRSVLLLPSLSTRLLQPKIRPQGDLLFIAIDFEGLDYIEKYLGQPRSKRCRQAQLGVSILDTAELSSPTGREVIKTYYFGMGDPQVCAACWRIKLY